MLEDTTTPSLVSLPPGVGIRRFGAGSDHLCGIGTDGLLYCWGSDENAQLMGMGYSTTARPFDVPVAGDLEGVSSGWRHTCVHTDLDEVVCWGLNTARQVAPTGATVATPVAAPISGTHVATGGEFTCVVNNGVYCWGHNELGQLNPDPQSLGNVYASPVRIEFKGAEHL